MPRSTGNTSGGGILRKALAGGCRSPGGGPRSGFVFRRPGHGGGEPLGVIVKADRGGDTVMLELAADSGPTVDRRAGMALAALVESGGWM